MVLHSVAPAEHKKRAYRAAGQCVWDWRSSIVGEVHSLRGTGRYFRSGQAGGHTICTVYAVQMTMEPAGAKEHLGAVSSGASSCFVLHHTRGSSFLEGCLRDVCMSLKIAYSGCCISTLSFALTTQSGGGQTNRLARQNPAFAVKAFKCNHTVMRNKWSNSLWCLPNVCDVRNKASNLVNSHPTNLMPSMRHHQYSSMLSFIGSALSVSYMYLSPPLFING